MIDGGLAKLLKGKFPEWHWVRIETGAVSPGSPDLNFCAPGGIEGWIELKQTKHWKVTFQPLQIPWIHRRARLGGRVFIVIRRNQEEIYVISGRDILDLEEKGLKEFEPIPGKGVRKWDWKIVENILLGEF